MVDKPRKTNKLLIVDDSPLFRRALASIIEKDPSLQLVGMAADGEKAMKLVVERKPDVILLDLEMPQMDGFTFLRWLMAYFPTPVLVVSSQSDGYSVFKALELGASDFLDKPSEPESFLKQPQQLITKITVLSKIPKEKIAKRYATLAQSQAPVKEAPSPEGRKVFHLIAIGASTGGPPAIQEIVTRLPEGLPAAVAVSQHMPAGFTKSFSERLNKSSHLPVLEATGGERLENGRVYVAPGGYHLLFKKRDQKVFTVLEARRNEDRYAPSIDRMMTSAAEIFGVGVLGIVLTGMGDDGKMGLKAIKEMGGRAFAESEETAVVYGMPRESARAGVVDQLLPLHRMVDEILKYYGIESKDGSNAPPK